MRYSLHRISAANSHGYFSVNNLHYVAADTHIGDRIAALFGEDVEQTRAPGFDSLFNQPLIFWLQHAMAHRPRGAASCGRARGRVFTVVEDHASVQSGPRVHGFWADEIEEAIVAEAAQVALHLVPA